MISKAQPMRNHRVLIQMIRAFLNGFILVAIFL